jgi:hypothetical protein
VALARATGVATHQGHLLELFRQGGWLKQPTWEMKINEHVSDPMCYTPLTSWASLAVKHGTVAPQEQLKRQKNKQQTQVHILTRLCITNGSPADAMSNYYNGVQRTFRMGVPATFIPWPAHVEKTMWPMATTAQAAGHAQKGPAGHATPAPQGRQDTPCQLAPRSMARALRANEIPVMPQGRCLEPNVVVGNGDGHKNTATARNPTAKADVMAP